MLLTVFRFSSVDIISSILLMCLHLHVALRRWKTVEAWEPSNEAMLLVFFSFLSCAEVYKIQTPGNHPKSRIRHSEHGRQDNNVLPDIGELWVDKYCHVHRI